jgi:hypothetical protein
VIVHAHQTGQNGVSFFKSSNPAHWTAVRMIRKTKSHVNLVANMTTVEISREAPPFRQSHARFSGR